MNKLIVGNQKTYINKNEVEDFIDKTKSRWEKNNEIVICPSSLFFSTYTGTNYKLGGQNVSKDKNGATTGEISASQLKSMNITYCIVGHSERRQNQNESDNDTNIKLKRLYEEEITPILCIGETLEEKEKSKTNSIIARELSGAFVDIDKADISKTIIAYEPIWAIGTGKIPTMEEISSTISYIKDYVEKGYGSTCKVLYGGSVSSKNIDELNKVEEIDGYLIGGASVKAEDLNYIIDSIYE